MQLILGAGGPVSNALAAILQDGGGEPLRLISRTPVATSGNASWSGADLKDYDALRSAAGKPSTIYMCAGLRYDKAVWKADWPLIMGNIIRLTRDTDARLIFFDNVYMYGHVRGAMTESTAVRPCSVKGAVRAAIADTLMGEVAAGNIRATIARAADFYGSGGLNSFFDLMVLARMRAGKKPQWIGDVDTLHAFTYVPDAARGMALLGADPRGDNQIWHLPTAPAITGRRFLQLAADVLNTAPGAMKINLLMLRALGLFNKLIGETAEMYYQYRYDYNFDSSRFSQAFGIQPTPYETGIAEAVRNLK